MAKVKISTERGIDLCALVHRRGPELVVFLHGFRSDKRCKGRFDYIATHLNAIGYSTLQLDFGGCGESDDEVLSIANQAADLHQVARFARELGFKRFAIWAHSLGTRVALQAAPAEVWTYVLTAAGAGPVTYDWGREFSEEQMGALRNSGLLRIPVEDGPRKELLLSSRTLEEFAEGDQAAMLSRVRVPALLIHGDADAEERMLYQLSRRGLPYLPEGSRLEVISGATHGFSGHVDTLLATGVDWLRHHDPGAILPPHRR